MNQIKKSIECLGTIIEITINDERNDSYIEEKIVEAFQEAQRIEKEFSRFIKGNQLFTLNNSLNTWTQVSDELFFLIQKSEEIKERTKGAFDIQVKEVLDELGYHSAPSFIPTSSVIPAKAGIHPHTETDKTPYQIVLDKKQKALTTSPIDLGGIGKGYAVDRMKEILKEFENICINAGGDIFVQGYAANKEPWKIAFEHPTDTSMAIGEVESAFGFFASSNAQRRKWGENNHHLINPQTKIPAKNMLAVYIQGTNGIEVDAYSTALFVMGFKKAQNILHALPVKAMIIDMKGIIFRSKEFKGELFN
ncbi:FAD:protein FMN transferase [Candidatus Peregrinibacteria bacterium]|jgi:FAD:protein FMN transferase|nr:FAD:protein FMN transferase [Candidatus Peregrinibacteria bacterium]